ncbi:MAG: AAA family ATPase [Ignavibacteriaceae bacterium]|nr:AAA family ATPase [Ignavibacteriaceae bacterium]HRN26351.1 AAA family ATPase [Ignavibacteriaceae bacterium]HRP92147.1 AAA family ATPase [Ignavibacteriaceae bacterium]HRQ53598.1 AAA family ATPase [Ignavibacteriaceae bacterium]
MAIQKPLKHKELKPEELRWKCDPNIFDFESTKDIDPVEGIIGQERALKAIRMGVDLRSPGYNIYIAGLSGSGKATTVKQMLEKISTDCPRLYDYAYVNNFRDPDQPLLIKFQKGQAKEFKQELNSAIEVLKQRIPIAFESELYLSRKKNIVEEYNQKELELMEAFDKELRQKGFSLGQIKVGEQIRPDIIPLIDDQPIPVFQLEELIKQKKLTKEAAQQIIIDYNGHQPKLQAVFKKGLKISIEFQEKLQQLEKDSAGVIVRGIFEGLKEKYNSNSELEHLNIVEKNILNNVQIFKGIKPEGEVTQEGFLIDYFRDYDLNIILDNTETDECPVIIETNPTYTNLFGTIEKVSDGKGNWYSDFTNIKSGSMLRANGGYLVLNVMHLFEEPGVWKSLKRILTYCKLEIQESPHQFSISSTSLKPQSIDIDTKVILIGSQMIYAYLSEREYDFKKMFKVKADFDYEITRSDSVIVDYVQVIKKLIKQEKLKEFDKSAIAELLEISAIFAGRQNKLSLRFSQIADIAREASFWAADDGFNIVSAAHIEKAYQFARERHGMLEDKITEMFENKTFLIDTDGERVGQINALAVYNADFYSFGRPTRITATVSLGSGTIINVEREAGMSGRHYNKGMLIISGYFKETFGQDQPLSFNANLVFEQSYGMVDGDSASCAEIFALLSTLSGLPIKQSLAVTGSLNQKGDVQPIGGVNEKIEGFFDICRLNGLTGYQGVIIPIQNVQDLMLREEIIEAVRKDIFHIYPITRVEEGIEILTGVKTGTKTEKGYEEDSVFYKVENKIRELYAKSRALRANNHVEKKKPVSNTRKSVSKKSGNKNPKKRIK